MTNTTGTGGVEAVVAAVATLPESGDGSGGLRGLSSMSLRHFLDMIGSVLPVGALDGLRGIAERHLAADSDSDDGGPHPH